MNSYDATKPNLCELQEIQNAAIKRVKSIRFGAPVTNVAAGEENPCRYGYFVEYVEKSYTNKYGVTRVDRFVRCTDGKGKFWQPDVAVVYEGHLDSPTCAEIFEPARLGR